MTVLSSFTGLDAGLVHPPESILSNVQMLLRWLHLLAGITWIGLLYFFNLVNVPFMKELDGPTKGKVVPALMLRALWWFRWSAVVTVLMGLAYWMITVSNDAKTARIMAGSALNASEGQELGNAGSGMAIGTFFGLWIAVFAVEYALIMVARIDSGALLGAMVAVLVAAGAWGFLTLNSHGWESNNLLSIGIGGGIGLTMLLNVWGIIWRISKKTIGWTREHAASGAPIPTQAAQMSRQVFLASRVNAWLTIPLLFFMAAASHYPLFGR